MTALRCVVLALVVVPALTGSPAHPDSGAADGTIVEQRAVELTNEERAALDARLPEGWAEVELSAITYMSDGLKVRGYLALPPGEGQFPCVIFNRGGNREFGALTDARAARILGQLASRGYVAVAGQYRGNAGGEGREEFGGRDVNDVLALLPLLESLPGADASRIGMFGWSRGGTMTYLALARTDRVRAAVIGGGASDAHGGLADRPEMEQVYAELVPGWPANRETELTARSAVRWADRLNKETPILLLHGTADWRVPPTQALDMADALLAARHPFRLLLLEGGDHGLSEHRPTVDRAVREWLDRYVRDLEPWPSLEPHGR